MRDLEDGSLDVSQLMDVNDPFLLRLWSSICDDLNYHEPEEQGPVARAKFLQDLPHTPVFNKKGPKVSTSRWMSWQAAFRWHDPYHHTKLLVSLYVALKKGWLHNVEDVWSAADSKADAAESSKSSGSADVVKRGVRPLAAVTATQKGQVREHFHSSCQVHG